MSTPTSTSSSRRSALPHPKIPLDLPSILHLPEDAVWNLRKSDLRVCFLAIQQYALNPFPLRNPASPSPAAAKIDPERARQIPSNPSALLRLPLEIRQLIYTHLLPLPTSPVRGPHPRQLQNPILLTQLVPSSPLLLNHQIRTEALPFLYGSTSQIIHATVDYNVWLHKTQRTELVLSSAVCSAIRHVHLSIHLGSEKRTTKPEDVEADARISEVKKGIRKFCKWLSGADIRTLKIGWQEPPQTYTWEQKKDILDGIRQMRPVRVEAGEINWGLSWNKGKKFRFDTQYLKELERGRQCQG
ncbi:hypothetical protein QTJ16_001996 [Diplocarpon rosae]|uniref:F-box domain-containing protein n=1 Tax=Diplocarpon rosae TaxID=946125 RepID=A0AAD9WG46_9HELO|nr:hypothetical protein QTJ16_001996 [Diplocarpon rosae]